MAGNYKEVAEQFVKAYYDVFDTDRKSLGGLYRPNSMLTFGAASVRGTEAITEKLDSLPFQKAKHQVATLDAQPSNAKGGVFILVTGLLTDGEQNRMTFSQSFQLQCDQHGGNYYVENDIFKGHFH